MAGAKKQSAMEREALALENYMSALDHPLLSLIERVRKLLKQADQRISERIKWNAPSFYLAEDLATLNLRSAEFVLIVFHNPVITRISSVLLEGDYKDRRLVYIRSAAELKQNQAELVRIMQEHVLLMDQLHPQT